MCEPNAVTTEIHQQTFCYDFWNTDHFSKNLLASKRTVIPVQVIKETGELFHKDGICSRRKLILYAYVYSKSLINLTRDKERSGKFLAMPIRNHNTNLYVKLEV